MYDFLTHLNATSQVAEHWWCDYGTTCKFHTTYAAYFNEVQKDTSSTSSDVPAAESVT